MISTGTAVSVDDLGRPREPKTTTSTIDVAAGSNVTLKVVLSLSFTVVVV